MNVLNRIDNLMKEHGWSDYKLAAESGLSSSTIANLRRRNTVPSIPTLEAICDAFGITLSQFFNEDEEYVHLTQEQQLLFKRWIALTDNQKLLIENLINEFQ